MTIHIEKHITIETDTLTALETLSKHTELSKQKIKQTMKNGAVWIETSHGVSRIRRATKKLSAADTLHLYYDESIQQKKPEPAILVADEGEYSIWNKPYGMYSQGSKWGDHCTIYRWAEQHLIPQRPAFIVHRLDRAASGLIIIAHSKKMAATFAKAFQNRLIQKRYSALVTGDLTKLALPFTIADDIDNKPAVSKIIAIETIDKNKTRIDIEIETGRKHQIRKHLSTLGYPIIGDRLYGTGESEDDLQLQANYLNFICPVTDTPREYILKPISHDMSCKQYDD